MKLFHTILSLYYSVLIDSLEPTEKGLYLKYWLRYDRHKRLSRLPLTLGIFWRAKG